ncbi:MAG: hypothetical protein IKZ46_16005 [Victivallales bacterium]|nr:hypothetical protein [Victivallales bacterium]
MGLKLGVPRRRDAGRTINGGTPSLPSAGRTQDHQRRDAVVTIGGTYAGPSTAGRRRYHRQDAVVTQRLA